MSEVKKPSRMIGTASPKIYEALKENATKLGMVIIKEESTKKGLIKFQFDEVDYDAKLKAWKKSGEWR